MSPFCVAGNARSMIPLLRNCVHAALHHGVKHSELAYDETVHQLVCHNNISLKSRPLMPPGGVTAVSNLQAALNQEQRLDQERDGFEKRVHANWTNMRTALAELHDAIGHEARYGPSMGRILSCRPYLHLLEQLASPTDADGET